MPLAQPEFDKLPSWSHPGDRPLVIGIGGGSGSGKTTIAEAMHAELGPERSVLIFHDAYYRDQSHLLVAERARLNYDHPDSLETELLVEHMRELIAGRPVQRPCYDFKSHARAAATVEIRPAPVILLEGVLVLADSALLDLMDLKIYVDTDADLRFMRRLQRDIEERDRSVDSVIRQYLATVRPMHVEFVEPSRAHADLVIPEGFNVGAVSTVLGMARDFLRSRPGASE